MHTVTAGRGKLFIKNRFSHIYHLKEMLAKAFKPESDFGIRILCCGFVKILANVAYVRQRAKRCLKTALLGWFGFKCFG